MAWRTSGRVSGKLAGLSRIGQAATAGAPTMGSSLSGAFDVSLRVAP
jgi:hypothetical protein